VHADLALMDQGSSREPQPAVPKPPRGCGGKKTQSRAVELDERDRSGTVTTTLVLIRTLYFRCESAAQP
jgi:hypothetical protein